MLDDLYLHLLLSHLLSYEHILYPRLPQFDIWILIYLKDLDARNTKSATAII